MKSILSSLSLLAGGTLALLMSSANAVELPAPAQNSDFYFDGAPPAALVELGRNLFFDKIMSGNKNISCATCHNPLAAGADGLSLSVGEGGVGVANYRSTGEGDSAIPSRIGRHAPHLFNLGAKEFERLNWNGIHSKVDNGLLLPSGPETPPNLNNVLAGQSLFPIVNINEMAGQVGENEIANKIRPGDGRFVPVWDLLVARLAEIPEYVNLFNAAFDDVNSADDIRIQHYANAISAFQGFAFRSTNSAFDQYVRGDTDALTDKQIRGMELFYGAANCSSCHSGLFQTDHQFHGIAMPQIGPGAEAGTPLEDRGRAEATSAAADFAKFRTPSLRNVWITKPYGHDGAYNSLKGVVQHHLDPITSLENYNTRQAVLPKNDEFDQVDFDGYNDLVLRQKIIDANELEPITLTKSELNDLLEFLRALTDWNALDMTWMIPESVASGLPVED
ncbi:cytochrome-c peroxidase [Thalassolituus sp.]|jgi:cytochrome c peroxidase|uniref:cytochrome-c peroxidase n=1 Tax=Thalassolituus sp. TaxID=2030822 RepID=UPI002A802B2E|nr:cytochrome c peroxidase [Thalassolituus sp.]|tara:strand:+ start:1489 stop:2832 length:1344 start_codon:yes stop_codon:yes gene_type:complete